MRNLKLLALASFILLGHQLGHAQQPYQDAFLSSMNFTTQYPCGNSAVGMTGQIKQALQSAQYYGGGTVDLTCFQTVVTITADIFTAITKPITLILPEHVVTVNANSTIGANFYIPCSTGGSIVAGGGFTLTNNSFGGCAGSSPPTAVQINGSSTLSTANLNNTTPVAAACNKLVTWQLSGTSVSAETPLVLGNQCQVIDAKFEAGSDFSAPVAASYTALPATGGSISTRALNGPQTLSSTLNFQTIAKLLDMDLPVGILSPASGVQLLLGSGQSLFGQGRYQTVFSNIPAAGPFISTAASSADINLGNFGIQGGGPAIQLGDGSEADNLSNIQVYNNSTPMFVFQGGYYNVFRDLEFLSTPNTGNRSMAIQAGTGSTAGSNYYSNIIPWNTGGRAFTATGIATRMSS